MESFDDFLDALLAFESGWDRERYNEGIIQDWQLNAWAGGTVETFYPQYSSWSQLSDAEWEAMAYRSTNSFGFVGFQFGEALLIDLGYYDDSFYYGNGASENTWDGTWTGKNGVNSLDDFMTAAAQQVAIREAFGHNLEIIEDGLAASGKSLDDYLGTTQTYTVGGTPVDIEITLTGLLAAAHLRGAPAVVSLLLYGTLSSDEYGTSILQYIEQFGGFDAPEPDTLIAYWEDGKTGDEGLGTPGEDSGSDGTNNGNGTADVTAETADVVITWTWGQDAVVDGFDPATGTIFVDWFRVGELTFTETAAGLVIAAPGNNQSTTLAGIALADLSPSNFTVMDSTLGSSIFAMIGTDGSADDTGDDQSDTGGDGSDDGHDDHDDGHGGDAAVMHMVSLTTPSATVDDFDVTKDMVHLEGGVTADRLMISEAGGDTTFTITADNGTILSTLTLVGIALADLDLGNFSIAEQSALNEVAAELGQSIATPGADGKAIVYDSDGSDPPATSGTTASGGTIYVADYFADDIVGFDPATDQIDFGETSVHNMILGKAPNGDVIIDNPWWTDMQIIQGVALSDLSMASFGIVGNEHLRQDIGGVMSWELGVGPRDDNTVYIRSHEYGVTTVIDEFDPDTMMISFLYYGTRERLSVEDTDQGLVISTYPSGQTFIFTGLTLADLNPGNVAFHNDQVIEDKLEEPFGFSQNDVTLVSREELLTPEGPAGQITDGHQTRVGVGAPDSDGGDTGDTGDGTGDGAGDGATGDDGGSDGPSGGSNGTAGVTATTADVVVTWNWGRDTVVDDFDPTTDTIFVDWFHPGELTLSEAADGVVIAAPGNNQTITLAGVALADLSPANFTVMDAALGDDLFALIGDDTGSGAGDGQGTGDGGSGADDGSGDGGNDDGGTGDGSDDGSGSETGNDGDGIIDTYQLTWNWGAEEVISGFAAGEDILDFGSLPASLIEVSEDGGDLRFEILNNGGHVYVLENVQAEDLSLANLSAPSWSTVLTAGDGVIDQLTALGAEDLV